MKIIIPILFLSISCCWAQDNQQLTFRVDMHSLGINLQDTILEIGVRGNNAPLSWVRDIKMTDEDKDGIYTATVTFEKAEDIYFKYVLNEVEWEDGDAHYLRLNESMNIREDTFRYVKRPGNPFRKFIGEWTLKNDEWEQSNGDSIELIKIPDHYTICREVNTDNSLLWEVNASSAKGHILWVFDYSKKEILHSSSFYPFRSGKGRGSFDKDDNISLKIVFEGEPEGSYRLYTYKWISDDAYKLKSTQYDKDDQPTGSYYGGTFVRLKKQRFDEKEAIKNIEQMLAIIDDEQKSIEEELDLWEDQLEHLAPDNRMITTKIELRKYLQEQATYGRIAMKHKIDDIDFFKDIILMRGSVKGEFFPADGTKPVPFKTKNLFVFKRYENNLLKIWKVIYNRSPID